MKFIVADLASSGNRVDRNSSPLRNNGEERIFSRLAVFGGTLRTDDHFLDGLLALSSRIIHELFLRLLSGKDAHHEVGPGTIGVLLAALFHNKVLARSTRRHDALTQLAAKHEIEPMD